MIIPHVAVVGSLLLASSNPCAWAGINESFAASINDRGLHESALLSQQDGSVTTHISVPTKRRSAATQLLYFFYRPVFRSKFQPAWVWNRGACKATWIAKFIEEYPRANSLSSEVLGMGIQGWIVYIFCPAFLLLTIPAFCGGLVRYVPHLLEKDLE